MTVRSAARNILRNLLPAKPKPLVLMYHRIADEPVDIWGLAVTESHFSEQLQVLRRTRHPFALSDFVRNLIAGTLPENAVALTFDDGYVDNLVAGKPLLAAADIPATVFLATGYLGDSGEFWWDELTRLIMMKTASQGAELAVRGVPISLDLAGRTSPARRQALLMQVWQVVRRLEPCERTTTMAELRTIFGTDRNDNAAGRAMSRDEVRALTSDGLVTVGAHTVTHPALSSLEGAARHREIVESKRACEALVGGPVAGFAYPYGDFDDATRSTVMAAGFSFACTTTQGPTKKAADVFALPRIQILNWDGDTFERNVRQSGGW